MMTDEVDRYRDAIGELCRRFAVDSLSVFGSAVGGDFDPSRSDLDFLVSFDRRADMRRFDAYFGLKEALERLFGRSVDLVTAESLENPYFARAVDRTRRELYVA